MQNPSEIRRNQAITDARAKIFWGDPPVEAIKVLMADGVSYEEAAAWVEEMVKERMATLRGIALRKTLIGGGLVCVPIVAWIGSMSVGYLSFKLLGIAVLAGLYGLWLLINGIFTLVAPKSESGDVADQ